MEDHSISGYLERRTSEELEGVLEYCLQDDRYVKYEDVISQTLRILETRAAPCLVSEAVLRARKMLLRSVLKDL